MQGGLTELLFPKKCAICDDVLPYGNTKGICPECAQYLRFVTGSTCMKCGKEIMGDEEEYCYDCGRLKKSYVRGYPLLNYVSPVKESISRMKYEARQEYAEFYGRLMAEAFCDEWKKLGEAVLVPVPISSGRMKKRGYNQALLLAESIGRHTGIRVNKDLLIRTVDTLPQKKLSNEERVKNLIKAFAVPKTAGNPKAAGSPKAAGNPKAAVESGAAAVPKTVIIVDDIYTTGSTVEACTRVLLEAGVEKVYYTSIAIGSGL